MDGKNAVQLSEANFWFDQALAVVQHGRTRYSSVRPDLWEQGAKAPASLTSQKEACLNLTSMRHACVWRLKQYLTSARIRHPKCTIHRELTGRPHVFVAYKKKQP